MKRIAIIGFGNHVKKNILPAIGRMNDLSVEAVYVRDPSRYVEDAKAFNVNVLGLDNQPDASVEWVYIATPISTHFELASRFLRGGKHVICEKPLTESLEKTEQLLELAKQADRRLYEVCMYQYHKQFQHLRQVVHEKGADLKAMSVAFSIPHLHVDDIRYKRKLGGGALLDVGYYPISLITALFGEPNDLQFTKFSESGYEVDLHGTATFIYESHYCIAEWGIGMPYRNEATVLTNSESIRYDRVFSKPETLDVTARVTGRSGVETIYIGRDDHFVNMFRTYLMKNSMHSWNRSGVDLVVAEILSRAY